MDEIIAQIYRVENASDLDPIVDAVKQRRDELAARMTASLKKDDEVRFSDAIRPKYLVGMTAKVEKVNAKSVVVSCPDDPAYGRFRNAKGVRCPNSLIEGLA